jgi:hypothetical protein
MEKGKGLALKFIALLVERPGKQGYQMTNNWMDQIRLAEPLAEPLAPPVDHPRAKLRAAASPPRVDSATLFPKMSTAFRVVWKVIQFSQPMISTSARYGVDVVRSDTKIKEIHRGRYARIGSKAARQLARLVWAVAVTQ